MIAASAKKDIKLVADFSLIHQYIFCLSHSEEQRRSYKKNGSE